MKETSLKESHTHQKSHHLWMMMCNEMETQEWCSSAKGLPCVRSQRAIAEKEGVVYSEMNSLEGGRT